MAKFSPVFNVDVEATFTAGQTATVTNPGQAFELIDVVVSGTATCVVTVRKNTGAGATAATATVIAAGSSCQTVAADCSFLSTDNIHLTAATAGCTRITLVCRAVDALAPTWTNSTPA